MRRNLLQILRVRLDEPHVVLSLGLLVTLAGVTFASAPAALAQTIWYVDDDAPLAGDGQSWNTAFKYLQDALALAIADDEIRVGAGIYKPDHDEAGNVTPGDRDASFELISGVDHRGGFAGRGTPNPNECDPALYETVLSGNIDGPNSLVVVSGDYLDASTVLDGFVVTGARGGYKDAGFRLLAGSPLILNCTFWDNRSEHGGAIFCEGSPDVRNCRFVSNRATGNGGAVVGVFGYLTFTNCVFDGNESLIADGGNHGGGAICAILCPVDLTNCVLVNNSTARYGGAVLSAGSTLSVVNCAFSGNSAEQAGALRLNIAQAEIVNSVFFGNVANTSFGGIWVRDSVDATVTNCLLWNNRDAEGMSESAQIALHYEYNAGVTEVSYCCIQNYTGTFGDVGTITADPQLVDPDGADGVIGTLDDDLRLAPNSPCIDAGNNDALPLDWNDLDGDGWLIEPIPIDLDGNPRFIDDPNTPDTGAGLAPIVDIGAYELLAAGIVVNTTHIDVAEGGTASFTVSLGTAPVGDVTVPVAPSDGDVDITVQSGASLNFDGDNYNVPQVVTLAAADDADDVNGQTTIELTATGYAPAYVVASEIDDDAEATVIFVNHAADPGGDGASWETAFDTLDDALDVSDQIAGEIEIWVAAGTYSSAGAFELRNNVAVLGGFGGAEDQADQRDPVANPTTLRGGDHVVIADGVDNTAVLDGFTIRDGTEAGMYCLGASPIIRGCKFVENDGGLGGAILMEWYGNPTLIGCTFTDNHAYRGGVVYSMSASATFMNCLFIGNSAGDEGGALYCTGSGELRLANCRFAGNTAPEGGGLQAQSTDVLVINSVFSGNEGGGVVIHGGWATLVNCDFSANQQRGLIIDEQAYVTVYNSVLWDNGGGTNEDAQIYVGGYQAHLDIRYSCVQGWTGQFGGIGNFGDDPLFVDANGADDIAGTEDDDLHLLPGSACIDVGSNWLVLPDHTDLDADGDTDEPTPLDLDGEGRFFDDPNTPDGGGGTIAIVDMGAYEFGDSGPQFCVGDLNGDADRGVQDLIVLISNYGVSEGAQPCEGDIDSDGDVDLADLAWLLGACGTTCP